MLDFAKLNDPEFQARVRKENEERAAALAAHERTLRVAVDTCMAVYEQMTEKERSLVRSVRTRLNSFGQVTEPQERWLMDIARRLKDEVKDDVKATVGRWAQGKLEGEHPVYKRERWPHADAKDIDPQAYWIWVLSEVKLNGGEEEHCSECATPLGGSAYDGLCGSCADVKEGNQE